MLTDLVSYITIWLVFAVFDFICTLKQERCPPMQGSYIIICNNLSIERIHDRSHEQEKWRT